jgi:prepilin-type N-terminal cleavage/methylation domain-containing protein
VLAPERAEEGFTLVEVLVAFVVSALLLMVVSDGFVTARSRDRLTRDRADAIVLAACPPSAPMAQI